MEDYYFTKQLMVTYTTTKLNYGNYNVSAVTVRFSTKNSAVDNAKFVIQAVCTVSSIAVTPDDVIILNTLEMTCLKTLI